MNEKEALAKIINKCGSQAELARRLGVTRYHVYRMLVGKNKISHKLVRKLVMLSEGEVTESDLRPDLFYDYIPHEKKEHSCCMVA